MPLAGALLRRPMFLHCLSLVYLCWLHERWVWSPQRLDPTIVTAANVVVLSCVSTVPCCVKKMRRARSFSLIRLWRGFLLLKTTICTCTYAALDAVGGKNPVDCSHQRSTPPELHGVLQQRKRVLQQRHFSLCQTLW